MCIGHLIIKCKCNWFSCPRSNWEISQGRKCSYIPIGSIRKITSRITAEKKTSGKLKPRAGWHSCESVRAWERSLPCKLAWVRIPEATPCETPPNDHLGDTVTSIVVTATFFGCLAKRPYTVSGKKNPSLIRWPVNTAKFGDRINGVPLYLLPLYLLYY